MKQKKENQQPSDLIFDEMNTVCATGATGLVPANPEPPEEDGETWLPHFPRS